MKKISYCRNCKNDKFEKLFSLGNLSYTGKFPKQQKTNIKKETITLIMCNKCKLVQLDRNFNPKYLYGKDYGYRSGINKTMTEHLTQTTKELSKTVNLKKEDWVLDIASNDGTLINSYKQKGLNKIGLDPIADKYKKFYEKNSIIINDFFSKEALTRKNINKKFRIITALSVFYDLKDPNAFLNDVKILLKDDGIFLLEFADLLSIVKYKLFDTICHEHLEYYSAKVVIKMLKKNNLKLLNIKKNNINGGSVRFYISCKNSKYKINNRNIKNYLLEENEFMIDKKIAFTKLFGNIMDLKINLNKKLTKLNKNGKKIHGYGASTKGNVLLQYFKIDNKILKCIADRNPEKDGLYTPGTKVKILTEEKSRKLKPDYYLVLPWHFKKEILAREKDMRNKGVKFIFPLPNFKIS
jgi:2-polyprenyl-3-methyl-5-hydroxy-6-metoxy-1,4-benzoquinol methylase